MLLQPFKCVRSILVGPNLYLPRKEKDYGIASMVGTVSIRVWVNSTIKRLKTK